MQSTAFFYPIARKMQSNAFLFSFIPIFASQCIFLIDSDMKQIPRSSYLDPSNTWMDFTVQLS